jgi:dihydropteroate synthase
MRRHFKFRIKGGEIELGKRTLVMGVLNVTPDSFSDGGLYFDKQLAIDRALQMVEEGADIIDIGGESTRPFSDPVPLEEELRRVIPVIEAIAPKVAVPISIDTYKAKVASEALQAGASIVNDISGLRFDPDLARVVSEHGAGLILMHIKGTPKTMQLDPHYEDVILEIKEYLKESIKKAESEGVHPDSIAIDPGIGFGKKLNHNLEIFRRLRELEELGKPILVGPSRKSFIGEILGVPVSERLYGTLGAVAYCASKGVHIVRVHDVKAVRQVLDIIDAIESGF